MYFLKTFENRFPGSAHIETREMGSALDLRSMRSGRIEGGGPKAKRTTTAAAGAAMRASSRESEREKRINELKRTETKCLGGVKLINRNRRRGTVTVQSFA